MDTDFASNENVLGAYISGYHISTLVVNLHTRQTVESSYQRKPINSRGNASEIIDSCATAIKQAINLSKLPISHIGIAMPGPFDYEKGISYIKNNKKHEALYGLNVKQLIADASNAPVSNIRMLNDAASFLKGEVFAGVASGHQNIIGLTLGTGLGTARLHNGVAEDAALWQAPFMDSIAEDYLSERWFLKRYYELSRINVVDVRELATFYHNSNTVKQVFKEFAVNLAQFTHDMIKNEHPEMIVLSGDIASLASDCFLPAYKMQLNKLGLDIPVCVSKLNARAVLIGVATCWLD